MARDNILTVRLTEREATYLRRRGDGSRGIGLRRVIDDALADAPPEGVSLGQPYALQLPAEVA